MNFRISPGGISVVTTDVKLVEKEEDCYYVKINAVPAGVSTAQVMLLFMSTACKVAEESGRCEFDFAELCPSAPLPVLKRPRKKEADGA